MVPFIEVGGTPETRSLQNAVERANKALVLGLDRKQAELLW